MFGSLGLPELLIILAIIVVLFGVNKLPRLGKGLGEGIRNFKDSIRPQDEDKKDDDGATEPK
jgi:sec-independent protein translocase protein TatA